MTVGGLLGLLLYTVTLMAVVAWSAGFCLWPMLRQLRIRNCIDFSSSFWFLLGIAPLLAGLAVGCASLSSAALKAFSVIPDHCDLHPGHPHLCWAHADTLLPQGTFFWGIFIGVTGLFVFCLVRVGHSVFGVNQKLRLAESNLSQEGFLVVPSGIPAAFVAGVLRPRAYLTSKAFELLNSSERRIVAVHEREHMRRRDPLKLTLLRLAASLFPGFRWLEERWKAAVEVECDWACLENGAGAEEVSLTILKLARSGGSEPGTPALAYALSSEAVLRQRVENLLSGVQPRRLGVRWGAFVFVVLVLAAIGLSSTHHVLETVLGTLVK